MKKTGFICTYNEDRGFGFIRESSQKLTHIFFHINFCLCVPQKSLQVQFEIAEGKKGPMAINVDTLNAVAGIEALAGKLVAQ
jgi:cold shock CspA family protein